MIQPLPSSPQSDAAAPAATPVAVGNPAMPGKYVVKVIRRKCISAATCVALAPTVFALDEQNIAKVISEDELDEVKLLAAQSCPTQAIVVEDRETGAQIWPPSEK